MPPSQHPVPPSRRSFLRDGGLLLAGGALGGGSANRAQAVPPRGTSDSAPAAPLCHVGGGERLRLGLVGCGRRGTQLALDCLAVGGDGVEWVAMADLFADRIQQAFRTLRGRFPGAASQHMHRLAGIDAFRDLLGLDLDAVVLATPPAFRPQHFEAAVAARKHAFLERPIAVDAPGVRRVRFAGDVARRLGLTVRVGFRHRHDPRYQEAISRIRDGEIGRVIFANATCQRGSIRARPRPPEMSPWEYQLRHWPRYAWLGGDPLVEHHVQQLDVIRWAFDGCPLACQGQGGREGLAGDLLGQCFDHHALEFVFPEDMRLWSQTRQRDGCRRIACEQVHGTEGVCDLATGTFRGRADGRTWSVGTRPDLARSMANRNHRKGASESCLRQMDSFLRAIRQGDDRDELGQAADSTLLAIMGRMASHSGRPITWAQAQASDETLVGPLGPGIPQGPGNLHGRWPAVSETA